MTLEILWQDEHLVAVNKPAGVRTIPDGYDPALPHLLGHLKEAFGLIWVVHRLDKDTSGVILFARDAETHRRMNAQFQQREVKKEYHALAVGSPEWEEQEISLPLRVNGDRRHRTVVDHQQGKPAETNCRILERYGGTCLVAALPHTGYTHQIRAHLAAVGLPLLGDPLYQSLLPKRGGAPTPTPAFARTALHAYRIAFRHPITEAQTKVVAPYPEDFEQALNELRTLL